MSATPMRSSVCGVARTPQGCWPYTVAAKAWSATLAGRVSSSLRRALPAARPPRPRGGVPGGGGGRRGGGLREQRGVGERAQRIVQRVVVGVGLKAGAQVGPGLAQAVFVQRRLGVRALHAF